MHQHHISISKITTNQKQEDDWELAVAPYGCGWRFVADQGKTHTATYELRILLLSFFLLLLATPSTML